MTKSFLHLIAYSLGIEAPSTQTSEAERSTIAKYAKGKTRAVEIGVFEGVTTRVIAGAMDEGAELYAIDPFIAGRLGICWGKPIARRELSRAKSKCSVIFVQKFSREAATQIQGSFDFVFIDGDHSLPGIKGDWQDWSIRIRPGGIIALHDTLVPPHNPRVANLGSHLYFESDIQHDSRFTVIEQVDSLSVLQRKLN